MNDKTDTQTLMNLFDLGAEPFDAAVCIYTFCKVCNLVADNALYGVFIDVGALGHGDECLAAVVRMMPCVECKTVDDDLALTGMAVGIGYGLTSDQDGWSRVTTNAEAAKDFVETHNVTRWLVHVGELAGVKNAEEYLKR